MGIWDEAGQEQSKSLWDEYAPLARSAAEGHTGGLSEPIISALKAMAQIPYPSGAGDDQAINDSQMSAMQEDVQARKAWKEAHPYKDLGAQIGGAMIPSPVNVPTKVFSAAKNAPRALGVLGASQALPKFARKLPLKVTESVVGGLGMEGIRHAAQKPTGFLDGHNTAEDLATTGAFSAVVPVVGGALKKSWDAMKWTGKSAFHSLFGVTEENVEKYMKMPLDIEQTAPELADIKQRVDHAVHELSKDFESAKVSEQEAAEAFKSFKVSLTNTLNEQLHNAKEAAAIAKEMLADAYAKTIDKIKSVPKPDYMAPQVMEAAETLKKQVLQASLDAMEHLPQNAYTTKTKIIPFIDEQIASVAPFGDKNSQAIASLQKLKSQIENYAGDVASSGSKSTALSSPVQGEKRLSAQTIKKMIQGLQRDIQMPKGPTEFPDAARANKYAITGKINGLLKDAFPDYAEAMVPTARKTKVLGNFNNKFKTEAGVASRLGSNHIKTKAGSYDLKVLEDLEKETGTSLLEPIKKFLQAQGILEAEKNTGAIKKSLPEYAANVRAGKEVEKSSGFLKKKNYDAQVAGSKEKAALDEATKRLGSAKEKAKIVDGMKESQTSGIISGVTAGKNRDWNIKRLKELGDAVGQDFVKEIQDRHVLDSFKKNATRGSRNIQQGALVGLFSMSGHGLVAAATGAMIGGTLGRTILDEYGPDMGKRILYTVKSLKERPTMGTIRNSNLPDEVKKSLETAFKYWMVKEAEKEGVVFDKEKPSKIDGKSAALRMKALGD